MERATARASSRIDRVVNVVVVLGTLWGMTAVAIGQLTEPSAENLTLLLAIPASGLYTLGLYLLRPFWLPVLARRPLSSAAALGIFNAAVVETLFLLLEKLTGAEGVAAHPSLIVDLLLTMPWYALMVVTFVRVQNRRRFSPAVVLLLGALYELGADGVLGPLAGLLFGDMQAASAEYWLMLGLFGFWAFIPVYSSMVLAPSWLIDRAPPQPPGAAPPWLDALKPLLWLFPFALYLLVAVLVVGFFST